MMKTYCCFLALRLFYFVILVCCKRKACLVMRKRLQAYPSAGGFGVLRSDACMSPVCAGGDWCCLFGVLFCLMNERTGYLFSCVLRILV